MSRWTPLAGALAALGPVLIFACSSPSPSSIPTDELVKDFGTELTPSPSPNLNATLEAGVSATLTALPTPTPTARPRPTMFDPDPMDFVPDLMDNVSYGLCSFCRPVVPGVYRARNPTSSCAWDTKGIGTPDRRGTAYQLFTGQMVDPYYVEIYVDDYIFTSRKCGGWVRP